MKLNEMRQNSQMLSVGQVPLWAHKATVIERRARGQATEIVQPLDPPDDLDGLTDDELAEVAEGLAKRMRGRSEHA